MKLKSIKNVNEFLSAVDKCKGEVYLTSPYGDKYNLKSKLTQFVAIAALLDVHGADLELWCATKSDEVIMLKFFEENPETL